MNREEAERVLTVGIADAEAIRAKWDSYSSRECAALPPDEHVKAMAAYQEILTWPTRSAKARAVLSLIPPPIDTLEAMETRRRLRPLESRVTEQDVLNARRSMGPLDDDREPDVVDALAEAVLGPGWLAKESK